MLKPVRVSFRDFREWEKNHFPKNATYGGKPEIILDDGSVIDDPWDTAIPADAVFTIPEDMTIMVEECDDNQPVTTLILVATRVQEFLDSRKSSATD